MPPVLKIITGGHSSNMALGALAPEPDAGDSWLSHSLLPQASPSFIPLVALILVQTQPSAQTYALSGFHVSVSRGLSSSGRARTAWANAARAYAIAYAMSFSTPTNRVNVNGFLANPQPLSVVKAQLKEADAHADAAKKLAVVAEVDAVLAVPGYSVPASVVQPGDGTQRVKAAGFSGRWALVAVAVAVVAWWLFLRDESPYPLLNS